jgi:purine-nucleoside phosphorylase
MHVPGSREFEDTETLFGPEDFIAGLRASGWKPGAVPKAVIFTYGGFDGFCASQPDAYTMNPMLGPGPGRFFTVNATDHQVGICCMGIGAPAVVSVLELLVVLGVDRFVSLGTAGGLQAQHQPGDVVLTTGAVRDEGTSYHYLPADVRALPNADLVSRIGAALAAADVPYETGPTWTLDAPYRETRAEVARYRSEGVLTVEMEAAAVFAVAAVRNVAMASLLVVDGAFGDPIERPQFDRGAAYGRLFGLLPTVVDVLR